MATKGFQVIEQQTHVNADGKINIYKLLELHNEMKVMLIHDATLSKISVALDVHIGNFSNPDDFPGLAYLCQHIFLENKKYRNYQGFRTLVHSYGGNTFLTTSSDHSTYYFSIDAKNDFMLEELLKYFVVFFDVPFFETSWIIDEIGKINSKLEKRLKTDPTWFEYFERAMVESNHCYSKYDLCKKEILQKMTTKMIEMKLINFFATHYSSNIMTLCITGCYEFDNVEKMIAETFCQIPNRNVKILELYENPFKFKYQGWYVFQQHSVDNLRLAFPLPNRKEDHWRQAVNCIIYFLTSNHKNSLLQVLKDKKWCESISINGYQEARNLNFFHVIFSLLPDAFLYLDKIITLFFEYFDLFKSKYLISEDNQLQLKNILSNMFKSKIVEEEETFTEQRIIQIVKWLHEYSMKDALLNFYSTNFDYIVNVIKEILYYYITPQTMRCYAIMKDTSNIDYKISSGWDNSHYTSWPLSELIDTWRKPPSSNLLSLNIDFWPSPNNLVFYQELPKVIQDTSLIKLWYVPTIRKSNIIRLQSKMFFHFISPYAYEKSLYSIFNAIFAKLVNIAIKEKEYLLEKKLEWQLECTQYGIMLEVTSYVPVKYEKFLTEIISVILKFKISLAEIETCKDMLNEYLKSFETLKPTEQAFYYLSKLLLEKSWTHENAMEAIPSDITIEIQKFIKNFICNMYIKCLMYGDITKEEALTVTKHLEFAVRDASNVLKIKQINLPLNREIQLEDNIHILYEVETDHDVSSILVYYQIGKETLELTSKLILVCYIMSEKCSMYFEKFKDFINVTNVTLPKTGSVQGLIFIIESFLDPYVIQYYIQQFISHVLDYISNLSERAFKNYKTKLIPYFKERELLDVADALWKEDFTMICYFNQEETIEQCIEQINQEQLVTFYMQAIHEKESSLSVHVLSKRMDKKGGASTSGESSVEQSPTKSPTKKKGLKSMLSKYKKNIETIYNMKRFSRHRFSKKCFTKIDNILLYKERQIELENFYK